MPEIEPSIAQMKSSRKDAKEAKDAKEE